MAKRDKLLTAAEAAQLLGVTATRVRQFCTEGRMGRRFGAAWMLTAREVERFKELPKRKGGRSKKIPK